MAKVTMTETPAIPVPPPERKFTLELTEQEAWAVLLCTICVGGHPERSLRGAVDRVNAELLKYFNPLVSTGSGASIGSVEGVFERGYSDLYFKLGYPPPRRR